MSDPVEYSQDNDQVYIFSHANWWRNLCIGAPVTLRIRGRDLQRLAEPVAEDKRAVAAGLMEHLRKVPGDARYYGVALNDSKNPRAEDVEKAAQSVVMLILLLPPEAYIAIGMAFTLLLLTTLAAVVAGRSRIVDDAAGRLITPTR